MKFCSAFLAISAFLCPALWAQRQSLDFLVSKATDKDKLVEVFEAVAKIDYEAKLRERSLTRSQLRVANRIDDSNFVVRAIEGTTYYWLVAASPLNLADGETFSMTVTKTDEIKEYGTSSYRIIRQIPGGGDVPMMTKDQFVERLKLGEVFQLHAFGQARCEACGGAGQKAMAKHSERECKKCNGRGTVQVDYTVRW
jgi:hypothetical protein